MRWAIALLLVAACGAKEESEDYLRKSKQLEGRVKLKGISRNAKQIVADTGTLPVGSVGPTPVQPCCSSADKKCPVNQDEWKHAIWDQLSVYADAPHYFQYSYKSDGKSFTATATGDVLCEGKPATFTITGAIENGNLVVDESQVESSK
jgi:hypothetical protein